MVSDSTIICAGDFITSTTLDYRLAHAAELCGYLAAPQSVDNFLSELNDSSKIDLRMETNCLDVMRELERQAIVISMSTTLHPIVHDFFHLNLKY